METNKTTTVKDRPDVAGRPVLVTTAHRGVFFGYARETDGPQILLEHARLCIYWPPKTKGFMGLAAKGPVDGSRIGPPATITLRDITSVSEVTPEAEERWPKARWQT